MILKRLFILQLFLLVFMSTLLAQRDVTLKIVHTSDVHGALFPFDYINNTAVDHGMAHVFTYVSQLRATSEHEVILLDNGDILQGQPTVYFANYVDTTSNQHLVSRVLNYMGYDAATVGNHDIEAGSKIYNKLVEEFNFPWLSANIIDTRTGNPFFKPYTVIEKNGVRVAVMGLTTPGVTKWLSPSLWPNMQFVDMIESAKMWMDSIKVKESPHVIIGLFHSGHDATYEGAEPEKPFNENASLLVAQQVPGFDAVLIGHDHDLLVKRVKNIVGDTVIIIDPGSRARNVSELTVNITLDKDDNLKKKQLSGKLVSMQGLMPNPHYVSQFSGFTRKVEEFVDRQIGTLTSSVTTRDAYFGPSSFVNLIHSAQLGISNCDISFAAPLSFDATIEQGNIFVRDMFKLYIYENLLYIMSLSGQEVKDYLEYSYGIWFNTMQSENDHLLLLRKDELGNLILKPNGLAMLRSSYFNFDSAAGIRYQVDVSQPVGNRIKILSMEDGTPFSLDKTYRVAINSYRGTGGGGHLTAGAGLTDEEIQSRILSVSTHDMRHYLMRWIEQKGRIIPSISKNWEIIPEEWMKIVIPRDRKLLFGEE